jgi:hypothetical protein
MRLAHLLSLSVTAVAGLVALACGSTAETTPAETEPTDASEDQTSGSSGDDGGDESSADATTAADSSIARCFGATYSTAPGGAMCDPNRIERSGSFDPPCYGPGVGAFCDRLEVTVQVSDEGALPPGFVCGDPELGVATCRWSFDDDAAVHAIDEAALEAACAVTRALSTAKVLCAIHGS